METTPSLKQQIKRMMMENLMLQLTPEQIDDAQPLFGPGGIGLDSVDALQLVVALDKNFGLKIADSDTAKKVLASVNAMSDAVQTHQLVNPPERRAP
jgi:acyl carrier protein